MLPIDTTESVDVLIEGQTILLPKNIAANDETLKRALAPFYPGVSNSTIKRDEKTGKIEIIKRAGTKGSNLYGRKVTITLPFWIATKFLSMIQEWTAHEKAGQEFARQDNNESLTESYKKILLDYEEVEQNIRQGIAGAPNV